MLRLSYCRNSRIWIVQGKIRWVKARSSGTTPALDTLQSKLDSNPRPFNSNIWGMLWRSQVVLFKASKIQNVVMRIKIKKVRLTARKVKLTPPCQTFRASSLRTWLQSNAKIASGPRCKAIRTMIVFSEPMFIWTFKIIRVSRQMNLITKLD